MAGRGLGQLFARKSVEQMHAEHAGGELKKSLGAINLILLGIGCIIGTGIFVLTGRAAAEFAGPGIMISFVITGTLCALVAPRWSCPSDTTSSTTARVSRAEVTGGCCLTRNTTPRARHACCASCWRIRVTQPKPPRLAASFAPKTGRASRVI